MLYPSLDGYAEWLAVVKARTHAARQHAALAPNKEMLKVNWKIGQDRSARRHEWCAGIIAQASADLYAQFTEMEGFSRSNLQTCEARERIEKKLSKSALAQARRFVKRARAKRKNGGGLRDDRGGDAEGHLSKGILETTC